MKRTQAVAAVVFAAFLISTALTFAQQPGPLIVRSLPPPLDDLETDADQDGVPDGWYNLRDARAVQGGVVGPTCFEFKNDRPGRPARASRAFGIDGRTARAIVVGLWIKVDSIARGERVGEEPQLSLDLLNEALRPVRHATLGPWLPPSVPNGEWLRVARRIDVPPDTRDAILTIGLIGATGTLWVDGLTIEPVPIDAEPTDNLVLNGDLELGDPAPTFWNVKNGARRTFPGHDSASALELTRSGAQAQIPLAVPISHLASLQVQCDARASGLRASGGATAALYFLDSAGRVLPGPSGGQRLFRFAGTSSWQPLAATVSVPSGARHAVIQFDKSDGLGSLTVDNIRATSAPDATRARWSPGDIRIDTSTWRPFEPAATIEPGSALDASLLLDPPAGRKGFIKVQGGRLTFESGGRARFLGVALLPPLAVAEPDAADALADNLARRGVNLARFVDLDAPFGPGRSLIDDSADDTLHLDPASLARFDHVVAVLRKRGIYIALDLNSARRVRAGDDVGSLAFPPGGGPAAGFDPRYKALITRFARALLDHVNPETQLALKDDPALAWVAISGETSLFDLIDDPHALPPASAKQLRELSEAQASASGRRLWQTLESDQWRAIAADLRAAGLRVPIAGASHWRREPEFNAAQAVSGLDMIDDRIFTLALPHANPERRGLRFSASGGIAADAAHKRRADRPFVVSQWCARTDGMWAAPDEAADLLLVAARAAADDWDALVRRGVFAEPQVWGTAPPGTRGGLDVFAIPEVLNANPALFAMLPHAASIFLRGSRVDSPTSGRRTPETRSIVDSATGRVVLQSPYTCALAVLDDRRPATFGDLTLEVETPGAVLAVSAVGPQTLAEATRLLVTAVGRVEPTGHTYMDANMTKTASPGGPPILLEPVWARVTWKRAVHLEAHALDASGKRIATVPLRQSPAGSELRLTGGPGVHWELIASPAAGAP